MRVLLASGDTALAEGMMGAFDVDAVATLPAVAPPSAPPSAAWAAVAASGGAGGLATLTEPQAFAGVDQVAPAAVLVVPDWTREGTDELRGCWWLARAADLAGALTVLVSTAAVFDGADGGRRDESARPEPSTDAGRRAFAAEQIVQRSTAAAVIVRVGPTDVGTGRLERLLGGSGMIGGAAGGAPGAVLQPRGGEGAVTPVTAAELGRVVRALAVGRRPGVFHVAGAAITLTDAADRLGVPSPAGGFRAAPPPLVSVLCPMLGITEPTAWPDGPQAGASSR